MRIEIDDRETVRATGLSSRWHPGNCLHLYGYTHDGKYVNVILDLQDLEAIADEYTLAHENEDD